MDGQILGLVVTAVVSVLTTVVTLLYGPAWKDRIDTRRARAQRSEHLLAKYSEPLARAAYDLQSRLYNSHARGFLTSRRVPDDYKRLSTLWLLGQYLAWVEIVRREIQVVDYGDVGATSAFQRHLFTVTDVVSSNGIKDRTYRLFRADQRAIGELMVVDRTTGGDSMGYAEFCRRLDDDPAFARWFTGIRLLDNDTATSREGGERGVLIQRALIDLIDFFDPGHVRFPDPDERTKAPLPAGVTERRQLRSEIARFRDPGDAVLVTLDWAAEHGLDVVHREPDRVVVRLSRWTPRVRSLVCTRDAGWTELQVWPSREPGDTPGHRLSRSQTGTVNDLLRRLDRPALVRSSGRR